MLINKGHILAHFKEHLEVLCEERDVQRGTDFNFTNTIKIESVKYIIGLIEEDMEKNHPSPLKSKKERR